MPFPMTCGSLRSAEWPVDVAAEKVPHYSSTVGMYLLFHNRADAETEMIGAHAE
jgi:hypothetical protein